MGTKARIEGLREAGPGGVIGTFTDSVSVAPMFQSVLVSRNYTVGRTNRFVLVDATPGNVVITLPAQPQSVPIVVKKTDSTVNTVTVGVSGPGSIDGALTQVISTQWGTLVLNPDGKNWFIVAKF